MPTLFSTEDFLSAAAIAEGSTQEAPRPNVQESESVRLRAAIDAMLESETYRNALFRIPFPPVAGTGIGYASDVPNIGYTVKNGLTNIRTIDRYWQKHRRAEESARVLDFGCGSGRLLRFPCAFGRNVSMQGCDVNPKAVGWLRENMPCSIHLIKKDYDLSFLSEPVDLIYAWSIFTHFSEGVHLRWLEALLDALRPGGLLIATFKSTAMLDRLEKDAEYRKFSRADSLDLAELRREAAKGFLFYPIYDVGKSADHGIDAETFGQAYLSNEYIEREWSRFGDVVEVGAAVPNWQDMAIVRKRNK